MTTVSFIYDEFAFDVLLTEEPFLVVDCTAAWCGPCRVVAPLMDQLAQEYGDRLKVFKLDLDANKPVAKRFGVKSIPTVLYFKQGKLQESLVGVKPYAEFASAVQRLFGE